MQLQPVMGAEEVNALIASAYPQLNGRKPDYYAVSVRPGGCTVRLDAREKH